MFVKEFSKERQAEQKRRRELVRGCTRFLSGHGPVAPEAEMAEVAEYCRRTGAEADVYGTGEFLNGFEEEMASLLGMEAAVFMPSGIMAQQIALRIWADRAASRHIGLHATSHVEVNEQLAYVHLHRLVRVPLGEKNAPYTAADLSSRTERMSSALLELPYRRLGGVLPGWADLEAIKAAAKEKGIRLHLDGARLWESQPYYGRTLAELCRGFDSAYVSFYKGIGAMTGSMLLGAADFIKDARIWQRRHGGNLYTLHPFAVSSKINFEKRRDRFPEYWDQAKRLARDLAPVEGLTVRPVEPHTPLLHLLLRGAPETLSARRDRIAREEKLWLGGILESDVPGSALLEAAVGDATLTLDVRELAATFRRLLAPGP
ncbi:MAG TPA: beta-eliminating lyase-related protein [Planctomycetota bacterium]|nr:beta-eliminating lyase-related protein [Planctomycetota bacterium]